MSETLSPVMCEVLGRLLARPPQDQGAAMALAAALRALLPEARATYLLGPRFCVWSPEDVPPELRPPLTVPPGLGEWSSGGLVFRGTDTPLGTLGAAVVAEAADTILPRLQLAGALVTAAWRAEGWGHPQTQALLTLGEASGGLVHTLNNQLNGMVMYAAVLQTQVPEALRDRAAAIRRLGAEAAGLARPAQAVRPWPASSGMTACLYTAFLEAWFEADDQRLSAALVDPGPFPVPASPLGLRRLLGLLLGIARACVGAEVDLRAEFRIAPGEQFRLRLPGVSGEADAEGELQLPPALSPFGELQRQAAAWLAREQGTRLEIAAAAGGLELRLGWPGVA